MCSTTREPVCQIEISDPSRILDLLICCAKKDVKEHVCHYGDFTIKHIRCWLIRALDKLLFRMSTVLVHLKNKGVTRNFKEYSLNAIKNVLNVSKNEKAL